MLVRVCVCARVCDGVCVRVCVLQTDVNGQFWEKADKGDIRQKDWFKLQLPLLTRHETSVLLKIVRKMIVSNLGKTLKWTLKWNYFFTGRPTCFKFPLFLAFLTQVELLHPGFIFSHNFSSAFCQPHAGLFLQSHAWSSWHTYTQKHALPHGVSACYSDRCPGQNQQQTNI